MYFFDISDLAIYVRRETSVSGIQRVFFEFLQGVVREHGVDAVRLSFLDPESGRYLCVRADEIVNQPSFDIPLFAALFNKATPSQRKRGAPTLQKYRNNPLKYRFHYRKRARAADRQDAGYFEALGSSLNAWQTFHNHAEASEQNAASFGPAVAVQDIIQPGDQLLILGAVWGVAGLTPCLRALKQTCGLDIRLLVHDLIPLMVPEHVDTGTSAMFFEWLQGTTTYCTAYLTNSVNTARDLRMFLDEVGSAHAIAPVPLAQTCTLPRPLPASQTSPFQTMIQDIAPIRQEILNLKKTPFVLAVGTRESRKNFWRLAQAWRALVQDEALELPKLVFAGRPGSFNDDFNAFMLHTGQLGGWIEFADRPTDTELAFLYETCSFTAMVSHYEGWGLPIGESLSFGKTAVVARNSSMPEVGGDMVEYCDAQSIPSMIKATRRLLAEPAYKAAFETKIQATDLRTWDDVTQDLMHALQD